MGEIRVAIVGVGNCASSLVQGVTYYKDADPSQFVPGLMHVELGEYHVRGPIRIAIRPAQPGQVARREVLSGKCAM